MVYFGRHILWGNTSKYLSFYLLNEIWLYSVTGQIFLITLLMVFSLVAYLFYQRRSRGKFCPDTI